MAPAVEAAPELVALLPPAEAAPELVALPPPAEAAPELVALLPPAEAAPELVAQPLPAQAAPELVAQPLSAQAAPELVAQPLSAQAAPELVHPAPPAKPGKDLHYYSRDMGKLAYGELKRHRVPLIVLACIFMSPKILWLWGWSVFLKRPATYIWRKLPADVQMRAQSIIPAKLKAAGLA